MGTLLNKANEILTEKNSKIIPENIKKDVQIFDIIGTYEGEPLQPTYISKSFKEGDMVKINWNAIANALESQLTPAEKAKEVYTASSGETYTLEVATEDEVEFNTGFLLIYEYNELRFTTGSGGAPLSAVDASGFSTITGTAQEFINNLRTIPQDDLLNCLSDADLKWYGNMIKITFSDETTKDIYIPVENYLQIITTRYETINLTMGDKVYFNIGVIIDALQSQLTSAEKSKVLLLNTSLELALLFGYEDNVEDKFGLGVAYQMEYLALTSYQSTELCKFADDTVSAEYISDHMTVQNLIDLAGDYDDGKIEVSIMRDATITVPYIDGTLTVQFEDNTSKDITINGHLFSPVDLD